jgi:hypothetical protein
MHTLQSSDTIIEKIQGYATDSLFLKGALQVGNTFMKDNRTFHPLQLTTPETHHYILSFQIR